MYFYLLMNKDFIYLFIYFGPDIAQRSIAFLSF